MRGIAEYGIMNAVAHSDFQIVIESNNCSGCGVCIERCQFKALSLPETVLISDLKRCVGCGLCVIVCPTEALHLERRDSAEILVPPIDIKEWRVQRLTVR